MDKYERACKDMLSVLRAVKSLFKTGFGNGHAEAEAVSNMVHSTMRKYDGWPGHPNDLFSDNFEEE